MLAYAPAGAASGDAFAAGCIPCCARRRQPAGLRATAELAQEPLRAARLGRRREIVFGACPGRRHFYHHGRVDHDRLRTGSKRRCVRRLRHRGRRRSIQVRRRRAGLSKAGQDVRAAGIADKQRRVVDQPLVGQTKLAHILEQEGSDPADAWHQVKQTASSDLCRALLDKEYGISETAPAASPWRAAVAMGAAFGAAAGAHSSVGRGHRPPGSARCRRHRRPGCPGAGQSLDAESQAGPAPVPGNHRRRHRIRGRRIRPRLAAGASGLPAEHRHHRRSIVSGRYSQDKRSPARSSPPLPEASPSPQYPVRCPASRQHPQELSPCPRNRTR